MPAHEAHFKVLKSCSLPLKQLQFNSASNTHQNLYMSCCQHTRPLDIFSFITNNSGVCPLLIHCKTHCTSFHSQFLTSPYCLLLALSHQYTAVFKEGQLYNVCDITFSVKSRTFSWCTSTSIWNF